MKKIRRGVFETNSSSSHSISIAETTKDTEWSKLPLDTDGSCRIHEDEFGWSGGESHGAATKAAYCFTYACSYPELLLMLGEVIQEEMGVTVDFIRGDGYIDHESADVCADAFESKDTLKRFIFNPNSYLDIDNDNC